MAANITPESSHNPDRYPNLETAVGKATWPTPAARDYKGANSRAHCKVNGTGRKHMDQLPNAVAHRFRPETKCALNPTWVEWLMGWPIGWTSMDGIEELDWRGWNTDPADVGSQQTWATPSANKTTKSGEIVNSDGTSWDGVSKPHSKTTGKPIQTALTDQVAMLATHTHTTGSIPRTAKAIKHRVGRLKAIGNGQVPQCAAMAWRMLIDRISPQTDSKPPRCNDCYRPITLPSDGAARCTQCALVVADLNPYPHDLEYYTLQELAAEAGKRDLQEYGNELMKTAKI